jgi:membrane protease YdiL (CAAX protease family)
MQLFRFLRVAVLLVVLTDASLGRAQAPEPAPVSHDPSEDVATRPYTRGQAVGYGLTSALFSMGAVGLGALPSSSPVREYGRYGAEAAASAPLAVVSPADGLGVGSLQLGSIAAAGALRDGARNVSSTYTPYWNLAESFSLHMALYATYATYRDARMRGSSEAWQDSWQPWTADQLIIAPFQPKNLGHPIVYVPLLVQGGLLGLSAAATLAKGTRVEAGPTARDAALGVGLSFDAGVTEEALFRGFFYEEMKLSLGRWPARILDMTAFSAAHVPGEVSLGYSGEEIARGLAARAILGLLLDIAYDEGGLPESVALHSLWDTTAMVVAAVTQTHPLGGTIGLGSSGGPTGKQPLQVVVPLLSGSF